MKILKQYKWLIIIILISAFLRFFDINWDQGTHLHPDERFLTLVGIAMKMPKTFLDYLNPAISTFNPENIGYKFFVYGIFPVTLTKFLAIIFNKDNYDSFVILGRQISAFSDLLIVPLVFWAGQMFEKKYKLNPSVKFFAALIYGIAVLPIQLSHFAAVDTFLNLFAFAAFCFAVNHSVNKRLYPIFISALLFGLSLSSKVTAIYAFPIIAFFILEYRRGLKKSILLSLRNIFIFGIISFVTLKIADPYIFASSSLFNPLPSKNLIASLAELKNLSAKDSTYPPNVQWIHKIPLLFPLQNIILWGFGIPSFIFFVLGLIKTTKHKMKMLMIVSAWVTMLFIYQGIQTTFTMRYFIILYPYFALLASIGLFSFHHRIKKIYFYILVASLFIWPLFFFSIYTNLNTRVAASYWINKNIPSGSVILSEYWDDALPLGQISTNQYQILELPVFDIDTTDKWVKMNDYLSQGKYLILSSNRGWGSIPTVPERYPQMTKFYRELFAGKLNYKKMAEFTSYPSLSYLGIPVSVSDDQAEEAFTVYDHPKVMIFEKQ